MGLGSKAIIQRVSEIRKGLKLKEGMHLTIFTVAESQSTHKKILEKVGLTTVDGSFLAYHDQRLEGVIWTPIRYPFNDISALTRGRTVMLALFDSNIAYADSELYFGCAGLRAVAQFLDLPTAALCCSIDISESEPAAQNTLSITGSGAGWHVDPNIQKQCADAIQEIATMSDEAKRNAKVVGIIASWYATMPDEFDHGRFASTLCMAALYPDEYRKG